MYLKTFPAFEDHDLTLSYCLQGPELCLVETMNLNVEEVWVNYCDLVLQGTNQVQVPSEVVSLVKTTWYQGQD